MDIEEWNIEREQTKEEIRFQREKQAWKNIMLALGEMGAIPNFQYPQFYKIYNKKWSLLADRIREYKHIARINEKYGFDDEV